MALPMTNFDEPTELITDFGDFGLSDDILRGVYSYGFETPSLIQQKSLAAMLRGQDTIAQAQSGTGKTGAFVLAALNKIITDDKYPQVLIMVPTRELGEQVEYVTGKLSHYLGAKTALCIGGTSVMENKASVRGAHIIVGTIGRINDLIVKRILDVSRIKICILDEADQMFDESFRDNLSGIIKCIPKTSQICLFSATYTPEAIEISKKLLNAPQQIFVEPEELTLQGIHQAYVDLGANDDGKLGVVTDLYSMFTVGQCILYVNSTKDVEAITKFLAEDGFSVGMIHGKLTQAERMDTLQRFRQSGFSILVTTDLMARGIDIQSISVVINYNIPNSFETYLHRIGRSGWYGKKGVAINLITKKELGKLKLIGKHFGVDIEELDGNFMDHLKGFS